MEMWGTTACARRKERFMSSHSRSDQRCVVDTVMNRIGTARPIISPQEHLARQSTIKYWSMVLASCIHTAARFLV
jgi:hypothetical protein